MISLDEIIASYDPEAPLAEASTIPAAWYTDARLFELEKKTVFGRSWQFTARADQLEEPGNFVTTEIAGEPILIVRGNDKVMRGFFNVCRHHAAAVMTEPAGHANQIRCPYHGWTYSAMIRTAHLVRVSGGFGHHRRRVMPADVEETAHDLVVAPHNHNRLAGNFGRNEISRFFQLIDTRGELPRTPKDRLQLKVEDALVCVPRGGNGRGFSERRPGFVSVNNLFKVWLH
jgi:nitrite reductase/ring-hydroxylating ferredoxin subunit